MSQKGIDFPNEIDIYSGNPKNMSCEYIEDYAFIQHIIKQI